ncbi:MAG: hypothetical protein M5U28_13710 [Sandaracinaceae bacterium]|nr:hypothetical protein [Sandaracinaceae bacterium]
MPSPAPQAKLSPIVQAQPGSTSPSQLSSIPLQTSVATGLTSRVVSSQSPGLRVHPSGAEQPVRVIVVTP